MAKVLTANEISNLQSQLGTTVSEFLADKGVSVNDDVIETVGGRLLHIIYAEGILKESWRKNKPGHIPYMSHQDELDFGCSLVEAVEDVLMAEGIDIPNDEKDEDEFASLIYGTDYSDLENRIIYVILDQNGLYKRRLDR